MTAASPSWRLPVIQSLYAPRLLPLVVLLRVEREGRALCSLPAGTALHDELDIRFLKGLTVEN